MWTSAPTTEGGCPSEAHVWLQCRACCPSHPHPSTTLLANGCAWSQYHSTGKEMCMVALTTCVTRCSQASTSGHASDLVLPYQTLMNSEFPSTQPPHNVRNPLHAEPISSGMVCTQWHKEDHVWLLEWLSQCSPPSRWPPPLPHSQPHGCNKTSTSVETIILKPDKLMFRADTLCLGWIHSWLHRCVLLCCNRVHATQFLKPETPFRWDCELKKHFGESKLVIIHKMKRECTSLTNSNQFAWQQIGRRLAYDFGSSKIVASVHPLNPSAATQVGKWRSSGVASLMLLSYTTPQWRERPLL